MRPPRLCCASAAALATAMLVGCAALDGQRLQPEIPAFRAGVNAASASRHMAASANPWATEAGLEILRAGGSAVDAAIAIQMVLTLTEPQSSGLGGGAFLLHWDGRRVIAYDGRETAPLAADGNLFVLPDGKAMPFYAAVVGGRAVGTPGAVKLMAQAHRQYGRLPWARLFKPAVKLAEGGFPMSARLHLQLTNEKHLRTDAAAAAYFYNADGSPQAVGTLMRNPQLAATLRTLSAGGADAFYQGEIAADIVNAVRSHPNAGRLAAADFAAYQVKEREALCIDYRQWRVCGMPPPSSGGIAVAQMLAVVGQHNIGAHRPQLVEGRLEPHPQAVHLVAEVGRLAFADRALYVADADFVPVPVAGLLAPEYLQQRARLIGERSMGVAKAGEPAGMRTAFAPDASSPKAATSHLSVVDSFGHAVSMTTTIEDAFGARLMVRGFLLNNQLTDFSFLPTVDGVPVANRVEPGKRPRSSMAPTLVFDRASGQLVASIGSPGGSQIIGYVAKTLLGILEWDLDIQQAISLANFGSRNGPTEVERGRVGPALIDALKARGHEMREIDMASGLQGILRVRLPNGALGWSGGADPRREGVALGD